MNQKEYNEIQIQIEGLKERIKHLNCNMYAPRVNKAQMEEEVKSLYNQIERLYSPCDKLSDSEVITLVREWKEVKKCSHSKPKTN